MVILFDMATDSSLDTYSTGTTPYGVAVYESENILYVVNQS